MSMVANILAGALAVLGSLLILLASVGIVRMPDLYTRMQAASKAASLGATCVLFAAAVHFGQSSITLQAFLVTGFLCLTTPVAAHLIARAGYLAGVELSAETEYDALKNRYDITTQTLGSDDPNQTSPS